MQLIFDTFYQFYFVPKLFTTLGFLASLFYVLHCCWCYRNKTSREVAGSLQGSHVTTKNTNIHSGNKELLGFVAYTYAIALSTFALPQHKMQHTPSQMQGCYSQFSGLQITYPPIVCLFGSALSPVDKGLWEKVKL